MKLDSVYGLIKDLRKNAVTAALKALAQPLEVSLGVAYGDRPGDFRLAVRLRRGGLLHYTFGLKAKLLAKGEIDLAVTGPVRIIDGCPPTGPRSTAPLGIGASIGHRDAKGGTLGFFARRRSDGRLGLVSNNHVIAVQDQGKPDAPVVHPALCDGNQVVVANLDGTYPKLSGGGFKRVDCAFAALAPGVVPASLSSLGSLGNLQAKPAELQESSGRVRKIGRTTMSTKGRVKAFDFDTLVVHNYIDEVGDVSFENQIEIESAAKRTFSDPGDSGSLVFDENRRAMGLLFAETSKGGAGDLGLHYANPIPEVLALLQVDIAV